MVEQLQFLLCDYHDDNDDVYILSLFLYVHLYHDVVFAQIEMQLRTIK